MAAICRTIIWASVAAIARCRFAGSRRHSWLREDVRSEFGGASGGTRDGGALRLGQT